MVNQSLDDVMINFDYRYHNDYLEFTLNWKRKICSPNLFLKDYQYLLKDFLEKKYTFPFFVTWYRKGISVNNNASIHKWKKYIMNLDIKDFFWSITRKMLYQEFYTLTKDIDLFLDYITFKGVLPQGPPSSPIISNIVFKRIDYTIRKVLLNIEEDITYSRFVDDISIWFDNYNNRYNIFELIQKILLQNWFILNKRKIKLFQYNKKLFVTGMIISNDDVWIGYKKFRIARKIIYLYLKFNQWYFPSIKGLLLYIKWVDYKRYEQLKDIYFLPYKSTSWYQELFWINENWSLISKEKCNSFNREFNYNKSSRFRCWQKDLESDSKSSNYVENSWGYWK